MSLVFSDTTNFRGIVQIYEKEIGATRGVISGDTNKLKEFAAEANNALDDFFAIALPASGTWQLDDSNHTDYPIITANLVSGQRDYTFTADDGGNLILDIYRVLIASSSGEFREVYSVDAQTQKDTNGFWNGQNNTGTPMRYDKTANGFFLDPIPSYNYTNGLKVYINREASYFTYTDTTKKAGVPGLFHEYFALKPASKHAFRNSLSTAQVLDARVQRMEEAIKANFALRNKDDAKRAVPAYQNNK